MEHSEKNGGMTNNKQKPLYIKPKIALLSALYTEGKQVMFMNEFTGPITMQMYGPS